MLFAESGDWPARVRAAATAGFGAVEFWHWRNKDLDEVQRTLVATGVGLVGMVSEPIASLVDPATHVDWLEGLRASLGVARRLGAGCLIVQGGQARVGVARDEQTGALVEALRAGAELAAGSGVTLALEPLNTRVDHAGTFLDHTTEALDVVDAVGRPEVRLLYDIYHSVTMGETPQRVLAGRVDRVAHVHLADVPGRHEPGSGGLPWRVVLAWLEEQGYRGWVGLEYTPTTTTRASLRGLELDDG
jgi:hydroxypyruvate isomerase